MIILDASIVIKWFSEEEYTDKALEIRENIRNREEKVIVPDLLLYELANALKHNSSFDANDVNDALISIFDMDIDIITPIQETINSSIRLAFEYSITVYDAFYVTLAKEMEFIFITADKRLYKQVSNMDFVKFIGDV